MQIQFNPKEMDLAEASVVLGLLLPAFVKGCRDQGDARDEVLAGMVELTGGVWDSLANAEKGA